MRYLLLLMIFANVFADTLVTEQGYYIITENSYYIITEDESEMIRLNIKIFLEGAFKGAYLETKEENNETNIDIFIDDRRRLWSSNKNNTVA